ncbi:MAG: ABC transporter permease [Betaproteobacteria bacterium]|nr:ABC transporter permease [Betaproteobacteria bacterium]
MTVADTLSQLVNGLAGASTLFLLASGLSLIFGVTRVVNFAHGSLYMIGTYVGIAVAEHVGGATGFWLALPVAAAIAGALGFAVETTVLRRVYRAPELFQLLATFALVLILKDATLIVWGPEDVLGPRAPGLEDAVRVGDATLAKYDLFLVIVGPLVLAALDLVFRRTRWGLLVRAATQDREMLGALGVNQRWLFTGVFVLGSALAGLAGALQMPREPASLSLDLTAITDAFVVVVVGGLGSLRGAFLAAVLIGVLKALCVALGTVEVAGWSFNVSKLTLVIEFALMAVTLAARPWGLGGRPFPLEERRATVELAKTPGIRFWLGIVALLVLCALAPLVTDEYTLVLATDVLVFTLFATSLHFLMGPGGMASFGHAAFFGIGAYTAALAVRSAGVPMLVALALAPGTAALAGLVVGWFCVRLSGVYLAMLTLAFAQIAWSVVFQWDDVTGGSNGLFGIWPPGWASDRATFYLLALALCAAGVVALWTVVNAPFGFALRAARDASTRAEAVGIRVRRVRWLAFGLAAAAAGLAGALYVFAKGGLSPEVMAIPRSVDGLVMVLLGGVGTLVGPVVGAALFTWLQDFTLRHTEYWRLVLGAVILLAVLAFPNGVAGGLARLRERLA